MKKTFVISIILCAILLGANAFAQFKWEQVDLPGNLTVAVSPRNIVFAHAYGSDTLYRSFDEGATWDFVMLHFPSKNSNRISAIDSNGFLYSAWDSLRVSTDDGMSWQAQPVPPNGFTQFLLSSRDTLYLFTVGGPGPWVFRSSDKGLTWSDEQAFSNGSDMLWTGRQISPHGNVFGFLQFDGSVRLVGGSNYPFPIQTKFGSRIVDNDPISWMMFDYSGFGYGEHNGVLIRSSDEGITWMPIDSIFNEDQQLHTYWGPYGALKGGGIIAITDTETVVSYDHGNTWTHIGDGQPLGNKWFSTSARGTIFVESNSGLFRTTYYASAKPRIEEQASWRLTFDYRTRMLIVKNIIPENTEAHIVIYDLLGRVMLKKTLLPEFQKNIDVSLLPSGMYLAFLQTAREKHNIIFYR